MQLLFKQRFFSWFSKFDVYDENQQVVYTVEGRPAWGHKLEIYDSQDRHCGTVRQKPWAFLNRFELYVEDEFVGEIKQEFTFFKQVFSLFFKGWEVKGDIWGWNYEVLDDRGNTIMRAQKHLAWTDTYTITFDNEENTLYYLMIVLAIDAAMANAAAASS